MPPDPRLLHDLATSMLEAIEDAYAADVDAVELPDRRYVSPGQPVDICPLLAVSLESTTSSEGNPLIDAADPNTAGVAFATRNATYLVTLIRCVPTASTNGQRITAPEANDLDDAAAVMYGDATRVANAIVRAQKAGQLVGCHGVLLQDWNVVGPSGGHAGGALRVKCAVMRG